MRFSKLFYELDTKILSLIGFLFKLMLPVFADFNLDIVSIRKLKAPQK